MKKIFFIIIVPLLILECDGIGQNLVNNPGFENFNSCPHFVREVNKCTGWSSFGNSSYRVDIEAPTNTIFTYYGWSVATYTVPVANNSSVTIMNCNGSVPDGSCSVQKSSLGISELHDLWLAEENAMEKQDYFNVLIKKTIQSDSTNTDSLAIALIKEGLNEGMDSSLLIRQLVQVYYRQDSLAKAQNWLAYLTSAADADFDTLFTHLISLKNDSVPLNSLDGSADLNLLRMLATQNGQVSTMAKTILNHYYDEDYYYVPEQYTPPRLSLATTEKLASKIRVFPNPSSGRIYIKIGETDNSAKGYFIFTDLIGNKLELDLIRSDNGYEIFNAINLNNGIYFITFIGFEGGTNLITKFAIVK